jgi:Ca2+-binding RTX toxin-like protein
MTINVTGQVFFGTQAADNFGPGFGNDVYKMTADNNVTDNINGGNGSDTVDYSASSIGVTITLTDPTTAGGASGGTVETDFPTFLFDPINHKVNFFEHHQVVANLTSIENATGSDLNDTLIGNSGNNVLKGGGGHDILTGGGGDDTFVFSHMSDSPAVTIGAGFYNSLDYITDFTTGHDHIDLRGLANETTGHVPLDFVDHFTGAAGQVTVGFMSDQTAKGTGFLVAADLNGDQTPDFEIFVHMTESHVRPAESDFILA